MSEDFPRMHLDLASIPSTKMKGGGRRAEGRRENLEELN